MPRTSVRILLAAVLAAALAPAPDVQARTSWPALARGMAAPWPAIQKDDGQLPDYFDGQPGQEGKEPGTRYGDSVMGYALLQAGLRERRPELTHAGLRAVSFATSGGRHWPGPSVFEDMAVASAYNLARSRLPGDPLFAGERAQWEAFLRRVKTAHLQWESHFGNHWLVDAIAVLELRRSGLHSERPGAVLGSGGQLARRRAVDLINRTIPRWAGKRGRAFVLSDPPDFPIAYHGLSLGLYARAVELLGPSASPAARRALRQMVRASARLTAPDGDLSYFGRSQAQVWAYPATAYGAELAARLPGSSAGDDALAHAVARRALNRLHGAYPTGAGGTWMTPALRRNLPLGARGVDSYAGAPSMDGIALMALNWVLDLGASERGPRARLPADRSLTAKLSEERGRFAVVRRGATWFAVKLTRSKDSVHGGDMRYDAGLALAERRVHGRWIELVPQRPLTRSSRPVSAGPVLLRRGGGWFAGRHFKLSGDGTVRIDGGYFTAARRPIRRATLIYRPVACGITMSFRARRGERYALSAFFTHQPSVAGRVAHDSVQRLTVKGAQMALAPGTLASGTQPRLWRVVIVVGAGRARTVRLRHCALG